MSLLVCSYGGGRNSCAGLIGLRQRNIVPDRIQFSDTGAWNAEKPETYAHIQLMSEWCEAHGFPPITVVRVAQFRDGGETLESRCLALGQLPSIAYGYRACSERWKQRPQWWDWLEYAGLRDLTKTWRRAVFYDVGEQHRARNNVGRVAQETLWFPLVEWGWDLERCVLEIRKEGLPVPQKSACFYCPSSRKHEVLWLKREHPDLFARAVDMEHASQAYHTDVKGLGRHWSWEELGKADESQLSFFSDSNQGVPCMCFDGEDADEDVA